MRPMNQKRKTDANIIVMLLVLLCLTGINSGCGNEANTPVDQNSKDTPIPDVPGETGCTFSITPACNGDVVYIRQNARGDGSGSDWANALPDLPAALVRNTTYYIAGGTYSDHTFNDAESSTDYICIQKATAADHGTDTGWAWNYGTDIATFGPLEFTHSYYSFDGQSDIGFRILGTSSVNDYLVSIQSSFISLKNCDLDGSFTEDASNYHTGGACKGIGIGDTTPYYASYVTIESNEIHNIADDGMQIYNSEYICTRNNTIHTLKSSGTDGLSSGPCYNGHSDSIEIFNLDNSEFNSNFIYDNEETNAAFFFGNVADLYGGYEAYCKSITFSNNIFYLPNPRAGFIMYIEEADGVALYNNVFWGKKTDPMAVFQLGLLIT